MAASAEAHTQDVLPLHAHRLQEHVQERVFGLKISPVAKSINIPYCCFRTSKGGFATYWHMQAIHKSLEISAGGTPTLHLHMMWGQWIKLRNRLVGEDGNVMFKAIETNRTKCTPNPDLSNNPQGRVMDFAGLQIAFLMTLVCRWAFAPNMKLGGMKAITDQAACEQLFDAWSREFVAHIEAHGTTTCPLWLSGVTTHEPYPARGDGTPIEVKFTPPDRVRYCELFHVLPQLGRQANRCKMRLMKVRPLGTDCVPLKEFVRVLCSEWALESILYQFLVWLTGPFDKDVRAFHWSKAAIVRTPAVVPTLPLKVYSWYGRNKLCLKYTVAAHHTFHEALSVGLACDGGRVSTTSNLFGFVTKDGVAAWHPPVVTLSAPFSSCVTLHAQTTSIGRSA